MPYSTSKLLCIQIRFMKKALQWIRVRNVRLKSRKHDHYQFLVLIWNERKSQNFNLCSYACNLLAEAKVTLSYKIYCTILRFDSHFFIALQKFMPRFCRKIAFLSFSLTQEVSTFLENVLYHYYFIFMYIKQNKTHIWILLMSWILGC